MHIFIPLIQKQKSSFPERFFWIYVQQDLIHFLLGKPQKIVQKLWGEKVAIKILFGYFKSKQKVPMATKFEGGGGLRGLATSGVTFFCLFFRLPYTAYLSHDLIGIS